MFKQFPSSDAKNVEVSLNGVKIQVTEGITVAAMALIHGLRHTRTTPISASKRAPFCMMGVCYECQMVIDGKPNQRACMTYVQQGMQVEMQQGVGSKIGGIVYE